MTKDLLVIEDSKAEIAILHHMIAQQPIAQQCAVTAVERLVDALTLLDDFSFDAIILDLNLNDMHGICSLAALHAVQPNTPIIVRSGMDNRKLMDEVILCGAHQYLVKGKHDATQLQRTIDEAVGAAAH